MNENLTKRQLIFISALTVFGRLSVYAESSVGRDIWLVYLILPVLAVPLIGMFLCASNGLTPIECFTSAFGKVLGKILLVIYALSGVVIASGSIILFTEFIESTPIDRDVLYQSVILMVITFIVMLRLSYADIGKTVNLLAPIIFAVVLISVFFAIPQLDFKQILPIAEGGVMPVLKGDFSALFLSAAPLGYLIFAVKKEKPRVYIAGTAIASFLLFISHLRNVTLLGYPAVSLFQFPNYIALTQIRMGDLFEGMEIFMALAYIICQPLKSAICLKFADNAIGSVFPKSKKYLYIALPVLCGLLSLAVFGEDYLKNAMLNISAVILTVIPLLMAIKNIIKKMRKKA